MQSYIVEISYVLLPLPLSQTNERIIANTAPWVLCDVGPGWGPLPVSQCGKKLMDKYVSHTHLRKKLHEYNKGSIEFIIDNNFRRGFWRGF